MSIGWDPKVSRVGNPTPVSENQGSQEAQKTSNPSQSLKEPPIKGQPLETPQHAKISPEKSDQGPKTDALQKELGALKTALRGPKNDRLSAAQTAIALAFSYKMRRNRSARRQAINLLEQVSGALPEMAEATNRLKGLLEAEGLLQENAEEATLQACQKLIELLSELELEDVGELL